MAELSKIQSNFTLGEISELIHARVDFEGYYKGAKRLRNVTVIPQGGVRRRFGTQFIDEIAIADKTQGKIFIFDHDDQNRYVLVFIPLAIKIYHNDALVATVVTTYTSTEIKDLQFAQSNNILFITSPGHEPATLRRVTPHTVWTLNPALTYKNKPTYDFRRDYFDALFSIFLPDIEENVKGGIADINLVSGPFGGFTADHVGGLIFSNGGTCRIDTIVLPTNVLATIITPFDAKDTEPPGGPILLTAYGNEMLITEPVWSSARGFPSKIGFYQNRIVFGRTSSLPQGLWLSNTNDFDANTVNFNDSEPQFATSSISVFIYNKKAALIEHILPYKSLIIFTSSGVYSTPITTNDPLTPENATFPLSVNDSSSPVEPFILDNQVFYFDKNGKMVKNIVYSNDEFSYQSDNISVLSSHLIDNPISSAIIDSPDIFDGTYLLVVNDGSKIGGTLAIYQTLKSQSVSAWTLAETNGQFRHVAGDENFVYFIVEREINSVQKFYLEKMNFEKKLDCTKSQTFGGPTTVITGLSHLEGKVVRAIGDGFVFGEFTVSGGQITLPLAVTTVDVGLNFIPTVVPMPINIQTQMGFNHYQPKHITTVYIDFFESLGIYVDDVLLPFLNPQLDQFDVPAQLKTGFTEFTPMNGWDPRTEIVITQKDPFDFTLRGIGMVVNI